MNKFGSLLANGVHAQQLHVLAVEEKFQKAIRVTNDAATSIGLVWPPADDVVYSFTL